MKNGLITLLLLIITALPALAEPGNTSGPWGMDAAAFKNLSTALSSPVTLGQTVVVSKPMSINNKTVSGYRTVRVVNGGRINPMPSKNLNFAAGSSVEAGRYRIFGDNGTVTGLKTAFPEWFGAGDSLNAGTTAIANSLGIDRTAKSLTNGGVFDFDAVHYDVDSQTQSTLTNSGWTLPASNITIVGKGDATKITMTGTYEAAMLYVEDKSNITVKDIWFYGNNVATGGSANYIKGSAINFRYSGITSPASNINVENSRFDNFKSAYWVSLNNLSAQPVRHINYSKLRFYSYSGNTQYPSASGHPANAMNVAGNPNAAGGTVEDVRITKNYVDGKYIKGGASVWVNGKRFYYEGNTFKDIGMGLASSAGNPYAMYSYVLGAGSAISDVIALDNTIINPYSIGIYMQRVNKVLLHHNPISGQVDTTESDVPRAAISINGGIDVAVSDNPLTDCATGISVIMGDLANPTVLTDMKYQLSTNKITSTTVGNTFTAISIKSAGLGSGLTIKGHLISGTAYGVKGSGTTALGFRDVLLSGNEMINTISNIAFFPAQDNLNVGYVSLLSNYLKSTGTSNVSVVGSLLGNFTFSDNDFVGQVTGTQLLLGDPTLTIPDNTIINNRFKNQQTAGFGLYLNNVQGNMWGNSFTNYLLTRQVNAGGGENLGYNTPNWTGFQGTYIQMLMPAEVGTTPNKYIIHGYVYDTAGTPAWKADRRLTGN